MRKPYGWVWWLILPVCSTVVTGLRLVATREESDRLQRTCAAASSPTVPPGAPTIASVQPPRSRRHLSPQPAWVKRVGQLRLVKWGDPSGIDHETIMLRDSRGRTVARIAGHWVNLVQVQDLTGDGIPDLVLRIWTGCGHDASVYYVYSAGQKPRCLLAYYKRAADDDPDHEPDFQPRDLDGDGRMEIISWYDGFSYGGPISDWNSSYAFGAHVPLVLGFRRGHYVDVTSEYEWWLQPKLNKAKELFLSDLAEAKDAGLTGDRSQGMVQYYAVAVLLHGPATARRMVLRILPARYHTVFLKNCGLIEKVLADRQKRYAYPPAYSRVQAFASEAIGSADTDDTSQSGGKAAPVSRRSLRR